MGAINKIHVDNSVILVLANTSRNDGTGKLVPYKKEWSEHAFTINFGKYFAPTKLFKVSSREYTEACKVMDEWIFSTYGKSSSTIEKYINNNELPHDLHEKFPRLYSHYWDTLIKVNQNKNCFYRELIRPIFCPSGVSIGRINKTNT